MKYSYGWSYASASVAAAPDRRRPAKKGNRRVKRLRMDMTPARRTHGEMLGRTSRVFVALTLLVLSVVVLGKEEALRQEAERLVAGWLEAGRRYFLPEGAAESAAPVPETTTPAVRPVALVSDKGLFLLDDQGGLWPLPGSLPADLPVLTGLTVREEPGNMGMVLRTDLDRALLSRLLAVPYQSQISEIHWGEPEGLVIFMRDGVKVWLDPGPSLARDLHRLGAVLGDIRAKQKRIAVVDLRYEQQVVVRPKGTK
ncbi:MAG: cell division protein FtsQ/DivIB [candidate division FCPU426 bacterium]